MATRTTTLFPYSTVFRSFSRWGSKVMRSGFFAIGLAVAFLIAANAQAANSWGLPNEEIVRFEAKVVDVLCELSGDCPADGGAGRRQLGLVTDDGREGVFAIFVLHLDQFIFSQKLIFFERRQADRKSTRLNSSH